jgi:hypothetical protein
MRSAMMEAGRREVVAMAHPERATGRVADPEHVSLRELARRQGVRPVRSADDLAADGAFDSDEELAEFLAAVQEWRRSDPASPAKSSSSSTPT